MNSSNINNIKNNLKVFLTCLKSLGISEYCDLGRENFCVSTRSDSASENWVFYDADFNPDDVNNAVKFFDGRKLKFIWPVLSPDYNHDVLSRAGLNYAGELLGMSFDVKNIKNVRNNIKFCISRSDDDAELWARTAWRGFGGGDNAPENFLSAARDMLKNNKLIQVTAKLEDINAGTFLLCDDAINFGVYYFAVPPEVRRKKIAQAMMNEIINAAMLDNKNKIVLQSTPAGVPFYKNFGFDTVFNIPVFTNTADFDDVF